MVGPTLISSLLQMQEGALLETALGMEFAT
jgi:hypothetical protein